jgi:hypothetical protein
VEEGCGRAPACASISTDGTGWTWETDSWVVYRLGEGKRRRDPELVIPSHLTADEIGTYLDDLFHEWAFPGAEIRRLD